MELESIGVGPFEMKAGIDLRRVSKRRSKGEVKGGAFAQQKCGAKRSTLYFCPRAGDPASVEGLMRAVRGKDLERPGRFTTIETKRRSRGRTLVGGDVYGPSNATDVHVRAGEVVAGDYFVAQG